MKRAHNTRLFRRQTAAPIVLASLLVACVLVAALAGRPVWAAALGAGLCVAYWAVEMLAWRRGESRASFGAAIGVALGGMMLRLAMVLAVLIVIGVLARPAFATAAISFLVVFTAYVGMRLFTYPPAHGPAGHAGAQR